MGVYDTNKKPGVEPGIHTVKVIAYPQDVTTKNGFPMIAMEFSVEGSDYPIKQRYFPNQLTGIFIALGFNQVSPGVYDGDIQAAYDHSFLAELYLEDYTDKEGIQKKARKLRNFRAVDDCPAEPKAQQTANPDGVKGPESIAWEE